jgi:hypothetical protein
MRHSGKAYRAIHWIEKYCVDPDGPDGERQPVRLTEAEEAEIWRLNLDLYSPMPDAPISRNLAAYLALLHICGPEALESDPMPPVKCDPWTVWRAASPDLRRVLKRDGEAIICPKLGKRYPTRAA